MKKALVLVMAGGLLLCYSCKDEQSNTVTTTEVSFTKEGELQIKKADSTLITNLNIEVAADEYERQTGLMYRNSMENNQAMLFIMDSEAPQSFYMKNTRIPLDIIYVNAAKQIVSIQKNAQPMDKRSLPSGAPAKYVLEVNGGLSDQWNLQAGDFLEWHIEQ